MLTKVAMKMNDDKRHGRRVDWRVHSIAITGKYDKEKRWESFVEEECH